LVRRNVISCARGEANQLLGTEEGRRTKTRTRVGEGGIEEVEDNKYTPKKDISAECAKRKKPQVNEWKWAEDALAFLVR
jgi:hypothetical protein